MVMYEQGEKDTGYTKMLTVVLLGKGVMGTFCFQF